MKNKRYLTKLAGLLAVSVCGASVLASCANPSNEKIYTISFYAEGATKPTQAIKAKAGEAISAPTNPAKTGYQFVDWHENYHSKIADFAHDKDSSAFTFSTMPARNVTLYAHFEKQGGAQVTDEQIAQYKESLKANSQPNHLYYHYYRYGHVGYDEWDVWAWPYQPTAAEGTRFDWVGRSTNPDRMGATGTAEYDPIGGACVDIDLKATYLSGWDKDSKTMLDIPMTFQGCQSIGLQIVRSSTRTSDSGFWGNDSGEIKPYLNTFKWELDGGGYCYHIFAMQDKVKQASKNPITSVKNPFEDDDGEDVTFKNPAYDNVDWNKTIGNAPTASDFTSIGAGYQIQVSSFADSDGDGFGDIYGIVQKLPYISRLGVKALWLTPIQDSKSYHGYDITDYKKVDAKFGSSQSPAGIENGGVVTQETAMEDYKLLLSECESLGIKVVMDLVLNHTSDDNNWFMSSANLEKDYRGFYQWGNNKDKTDDYPQGQSEDINESKFWYGYGDHPYSYYAKFGSAMPELNYSYQATRDAVEEMSAFWVNLGVGGFRLDAVKHIYMLDEAAVADGDTTVIDENKKGDEMISYSSNLTKNLNFFKELKHEVTERTGKDVFFVGENFDGHAYHVAPYYEAFDSMFDFYAYFNLTSGAATGMAGTTSKYGTAAGWMYVGDPNQVQYNGRFHKGVIGPTKTGGRAGDNGGSEMDLADNQVWDFVNVYNTYNAYRRKGGGNSSVALPGAFTSNHDIARVINRIAGTGTAEGLEAQGNISTSTYAQYERSAMLVKIAEILLPGVTWVYYGDEIGMTGNFPAGKTDKSDYADLWYRQPMKWATSGNVVGDENGTTGYHVTGSKQLVEWDEVNSSSVVMGALEQMNTPGSSYDVLRQFIEAKNNAGTSLVTGNIGGAYWVYGNLAANTLCFSRDNDNYRVVVNFSNQAASINNDHPFQNYHKVVSYNGATTTSIPAFSAILMQKNG